LSENALPKKFLGEIFFAEKTLAKNSWYFGRTKTSTESTVAEKYFDQINLDGILTKRDGFFNKFYCP